MRLYGVFAALLVCAYPADKRPATTHPQKPVCTERPNRLGDQGKRAKHGKEFGRRMGSRSVMKGLFTRAVDRLNFSDDKPSPFPRNTETHSLNMPNSKIPPERQVQQEWHQLRQPLEIRGETDASHSPDSVVKRWSFELGGLNSLRPNISDSEEQFPSDRDAPRDSFSFTGHNVSRNHEEGEHSHSLYDSLFRQQEANSEAAQLEEDIESKLSNDADTRKRIIGEGTTYRGQPGKYFQDFRLPIPDSDIRPQRPFDPHLEDRYAKKTAFTRPNTQILFGRRRAQMKETDDSLASLMQQTEQLRSEIERQKALTQEIEHKSLTPKISEGNPYPPYHHQKPPLAYNPYFPAYNQATISDSLYDPARTRNIASSD